MVIKNEKNQQQWKLPPSLSAGEEDKEQGIRRRGNIKKKEKLHKIGGIVCGRKKSFFHHHRRKINSHTLLVGSLGLGASYLSRAQVISPIPAWLSLKSRGLILWNERGVRAPNFPQWLGYFFLGFHSLPFKIITQQWSINSQFKNLKSNFDGTLSNHIYLSYFEKKIRTLKIIQFFKKDLLNFMKILK